MVAALLLGKPKWALLVLLGCLNMSLFRSVVKGKPNGRAPPPPLPWFRGHASNVKAQPPQNNSIKDLDHAVVYLKDYENGRKKLAEVCSASLTATARRLLMAATAWASSAQPSEQQRC